VSDGLVLSPRYVFVAPQSIHVAAFPKGNLDYSTVQYIRYGTVLCSTVTERHVQYRTVVHCTVLVLIASDRKKVLEFSFLSAGEKW